MYNRSPPPIRNDVLPVAASRDRHARVCTTRRPYTAFIRSFDLDQFKKDLDQLYMHVHFGQFGAKSIWNAGRMGGSSIIQIEQQSSRMDQDQSSDESLLLSPEGRKRQNWPIGQTSAQNKPSFKLFHKITLFSSVRTVGAMLCGIAPYTRVLSSWPRGAAGPASGAIALAPGALCL
jgi:hypothetical protein